MPLLVAILIEVTNGTTYSQTYISLPGWPASEAASQSFQAVPCEASSTWCSGQERHHTDHPAMHNWSILCEDIYYNLNMIMAYVSESSNFLRPIFSGRIRGLRVWLLIFVLPGMPVVFSDSNGKRTRLPEPRLVKHCVNILIFICKTVTAVTDVIMGGYWRHWRLRSV